MSDVDSLGRVRWDSPDEDLVRVAPADDHRPASRIRDVAQPGVGGHFTRPGRLLWSDNGHRRHHLLRRRGLQGRTVQVGSEDTVTDGDSGSVSFHPDPERPDEQVLVAGLDNARTWWPGANYTWSTAAYHVYDRHGLSF